MSVRTDNVISYYSDPANVRAFHTDRYGGAVGAWFMAEELRHFHTLVNCVGSPSSVLDAGAGTGKLVVGLPVPRYVGLDRSTAMLHALRQVHPMAVLVAGDAQVLPFRSKSTDVIVASRLLMHLPMWRRMIAESCRVARQAVIIDFPVSPSFAALERPLWRLVRRDTHPPHRVFSLREVHRAFAAEGFTKACGLRGFVIPYRLHRRLGNVKLSRALERLVRAVGLTGCIGSPAFVAFVPVRPDGTPRHSWGSVLTSFSMACASSTQSLVGKRWINSR